MGRVPGMKIPIHVNSVKIKRHTNPMSSNSPIEEEIEKPRSTNPQG